MSGTQLLVYWILTAVSGGLLHASIMWLWTGKAWPIKSVKMHPIFATFVLIVGVTGLLYFGTQDLLQQTINML